MTAYVEEWPGPPPPDLEPEDQNRRIRFIRASDLKPRPLPWLIRGILTRDSNAVLFAPPASYKTFVALSWGFHVAARLDWAGHRTDGGPVFIIAGEGLNGLPLRLRALEIEHGVKLADLPLFVSDRATALVDLAAVSELLRVIEGMEAEAGAKPALVIIDTLARSFGPGDENSTSDMQAAVLGIDAIRRATGACVLMVHHSGHADKSRARGNSSLLGALDWEHRTERDEAGMVWLHCTKSKDAEPLKPLAFQPKRVCLGIEDEEGEPVASMVLSAVHGLEPPKRGARARGKNQVQALAILKTEHAMRRANLAAGGRPGAPAPIEVDKWRSLCADAGIDRNRFHEARDGLEKAGLIRLSLPHVFLLEAGPASEASEMSEPDDFL